jgi:hypothetical protein
MAKRLHDRLTKLLGEAKSLTQSIRRAARGRSLPGKPWAEVLAAVEAALPPGGLAVAGEICDDAERYHEATGGRECHGFFGWLDGLARGWWALPEVILPEVLAAWRDGHRYHPAGGSPIALFRCADCLAALPNSRPGGGLVLLCQLGRDTFPDGHELMPQ